MNYEVYEIVNSKFDPCRKKRVVTAHICPACRKHMSIIPVGAEDDCEHCHKTIKNEGEKLCVSM